jgi:hypothetical protein
MSFGGALPDARASWRSPLVTCTARALQHSADGGSPLLDNLAAVLAAQKFVEMRQVIGGEDPWSG